MRATSLVAFRWAKAPPKLICARAEWMVTKDNCDPLTSEGFKKWSEGAPSASGRPTFRLD